MVRLACSVPPDRSEGGAVGRMMRGRGAGGEEGGGGWGRDEAEVDYARLVLGFTSGQCLIKQPEKCQHG